MTPSMHASFTAIGRHLQADYLPMLSKPLPSELKDLVAQVVALEIGKRRSTEQCAIAVNPGIDRAPD